MAQSRTFDPDPTYVRRWVPELRGTPSPGSHQPWALDPPLGGDPRVVQRRYGRVMPEPSGARAFVPAGADLVALAAAIQQCRGCGLWQGPERAVFGEGPPDARLLLVGEQPGDVEDRQGFDFTRSGYRVPAILVSPWVEAWRSCWRATWWWRRGRRRSDCRR